MSEERKLRKPLMEKKRRARINDSLEKLKLFLLERDPQSVSQKSAKLEKADILELTVNYLRKQKQLQLPQLQTPHQPVKFNGYYPSGPSCWAPHRNIECVNWSTGSNRSSNSSLEIGEKRENWISLEKCEEEVSIWRPYL